MPQPSSPGSARCRRDRPLGRRREEPEPRRPPVLEELALDRFPAVLGGAHGLADAIYALGTAFSGLQWCCGLSRE